MAQEAWSDADIAPGWWSDEDIATPAQAAPKNNGLLPQPGEDQGALVRRRINALLQGVGGTANYLSDLGARAGNSLGIRDTNMPLPSARFETFLTQLGLDQPKPAEAAVGGALGGMADPFGRAIAMARPSAGVPVTPQPGLSVEQRTRNAGLDAGLKIAPRFAEDTPVGNALEPLANKSALAEDLTRANRPVFDAMARRINQMPQSGPGSDLTPENLQSLIKQRIDEGYAPLESALAPFRPSSTYQSEVQKVIQKWAGSPNSMFPQRKEIAKIGEQFSVPPLQPSHTLASGFGYNNIPLLSQPVKGPPDTITSKEALDAIKRIRQEATDALSGSSPDQAKGLALRDIANAIEEELARQIKDPKMLERFQSARKQVAIAHETMDALVPGAGSIDPRVFTSKLSQGAPLTGELKQIGEFSGAFSPMSQFPRQGESLLYERPSLGLGVSNAGLLGQVLGAPARKFLMSDAYQRTLKAKPPTPRAPFADTTATGLANTPGYVYNLFQPD